MHGVGGVPLSKQNVIGNASCVQVSCQRFGFFKELIPYIPLTRPLAFLDAGANAGFASFLFARLMQFQGELVSVEMNPSSAQLARRNLASLNGVSGFSHQVAHKAVLSSQDAADLSTVEFGSQKPSDFLGDRLHSVLPGLKGNSHRQHVQSTSLSTLLVRPFDSAIFLFCWCL